MRNVLLLLSTILYDVCQKNSYLKRECKRVDIYVHPCNIDKGTSKYKDLNIYLVISRPFLCRFLCNEKEQKHC